LTSDKPDTSTLSTKLEEDFISPLTAVRGSLEILRDFPDLELRQRLRFVESALQECTRLERGVEELATAVYAAGRQAHSQEQTTAEEPADETYAGRIHIRDQLEVVEIDFSDFEFRNSRAVNEFFDTIEVLVRATKRNWYFIANHRNCRVWPEAWVAFAHRGKKINVNYSLGTVRYQEDVGSREGDPGICASREEALAKIETMKSERG